MPPLKFKNSVKNQIVANDGTAHQTWLIERGGEPQIQPLSVLDETYIYLGSENMLKFEAEYELIFLCNYNLGCYPFDTQICTLMVSVYLRKGQVMIFATTYTSIPP